MKHCKCRTCEKVYRAPRMLGFFESLYPGFCSLECVDKMGRILGYRKRSRDGGLLETLQRAKQIGRVFVRSFVIEIKKGCGYYAVDQIYKHGWAWADKADLFTYKQAKDMVQHLRAIGFKEAHDQHS